MWPITIYEVTFDLGNSRPQGHMTFDLSNSRPQGQATFDLSDSRLSTVSCSDTTDLRPTTGSDISIVSVSQVKRTLQSENK